MNISTIGGAFIAALIGFLTGFLALLTQEGVTDISDIGQIAWIVLSVGALISFFKDFQALATRKAISNMIGPAATPPR